MVIPKVHRPRYVQSEKKVLKHHPPPFTKAYLNPHVLRDNSGSVVDPSDNITTFFSPHLGFRVSKSSTNRANQISHDFMSSTSAVTDKTLSENVRPKDHRRNICLLQRWWPRKFSEAQHMRLEFHHETKILERVKKNSNKHRKGSL